MSLSPRPDDFETRRAALASLPDDELHALFWRLVERIVAPLVEEARTHTSVAIERSVLLRMGLASAEAKALAERMAERGLLRHGAGRLLLELAQRLGASPRDAAQALLAGRHWEELTG